MSIKNNKETSLIVRMGLILLIALIFTMVIFKFFFNEPISEISAGLLVLIAILLVLVLSESFDNFSIGRIISLSREIKNKEIKIEKVESEKNELLNNIINLTNTTNQRQSNTNIYGLPTNLSQYLGVKEASDEEKESNDEENEELQKSTPLKKRLDYKRIEQYILDQYIVENNIDISKVFKEVKLKEFEGIDPVSDISPIYDAYIKGLESEIFIEIKPISYSSVFFVDKLYLMLSKVYHYKHINKTNVFLNLILVDLPNNERDNLKYINQISERFAPAIKLGLLKITMMGVLEKDIEQFFRD